MASREQVNAAIELVMRGRAPREITAALIEDRAFHVRSMGQAKGPGELRAASGLKRARKIGESNWIAGAVEHPGKFTAKARSRGMTAAQLQAAVLANPEKYDTETRKEANLRKTLVKVNH